MKLLNIQIQPYVDSTYSENEGVKLFLSLKHTPDIFTGYDNGRYVNITYSTDNIPKLWFEIEKLLSGSKIGKWLKKVSIITCEGEQGWEDYLLLSHYLKNEKLDVIKDNKVELIWKL